MCGGVVFFYAVTRRQYGPYVYYWHAGPLGADGKDYRANYVHAPFPKN
jgi:hypothetical protein